MNGFEQAVAGYIGENNLRKIQSYRVGIAGAGGLGSNCAFNLVRCGFRSFVIADFDLIEYSNLNRQFYFNDQVGEKKVDALKANLLRINPDLDIQAVHLKVTDENAEELFGDCHIIVEAFDKAQYKKMIIEKFMDSPKLVVAASGIAYWGSSDDIRTERVKDNFYIVGDFKTEVGPDRPPVSPRVNIAAAKQADIIMEYVLDRHPPV